MIGRTPTRIRLAFGAAGASDARSADGLAGTSTQRRAQSCCKRWIRQVGGDSHRTGSVFLKVFVLEFFEFCELLVSVVLVGRVVGLVAKDQFRQIAIFFGGGPASIVHCIWVLWL